MLPDLPKLSPTQAGYYLKLERGELKELERTGVLPSPEMIRGRYYYDLKDVQAAEPYAKKLRLVRTKARQKPQGKLEAAIYKAFDAGETDLPKLVRRFKVRSSFILRLYNAWKVGSVDELKRRYDARNRSKLVRESLKVATTDDPIVVPTKRRGPWS